MFLGDTTWPVVSEHVNEHSLALVPIGSTEQHGPHLPAGTDHVIAEELAREAAERGGHLCTPTVTIGVSPHHRQFSGTMLIDAPAFRAYMESLTRNLTYHGLDRVIYVNAHGGNVEPLREVARRVRDNEVAYAVEWMWDQSIPDLVEELFETNGPHAGPKETAMLLHLRPDSVKPEAFGAARDDGLPDPASVEMRTYGARTTFDSIESSPNGAYGDPTDATAEKGARLFEAAVHQLEQLAEWVSTQPETALTPPERI